MKNNFIWGFDISTSIIGLSGLDGQGNLILYDNIDLRKYKDFFLKMDQVEKHMSNYYKKGQFKSGHIFIEAPFSFFRGGASTAQTMAKLQRFNGAVSWMLKDRTGIVPKYIFPAKARNLCGIKIPRGEKAKKVVMEHLKTNEPLFNIEYTRAGNPRPCFFDMADAIVIARAGRKIISEGLDD
jgi:hypothetical protein